MPNYRMSKIYKIESDIGGVTYYGSTTKPKLSGRLAEHKASYKRYLAGKSTYVTSFEVLQHGDARIVLVQNCPCDNKDELSAFESYYIRNRDCVNKYIPDRDQREYYQDNKERLLEYQTEYHEQNRERILEYKNTKITCGCGGHTTRSSVTHHRRTARHREQEQLHNEVLIRSKMDHELAEYAFPIRIQ
jgi:adenylate kinase family enzyme